MEKDIRRRLMREDDREERELQRFYADAITADMITSLPGAINPSRPGQTDIKTPTQQHQQADQMNAQQSHYNPHPDPRQGGR